MGKSIKKTVEMPVSAPQPAGMQKKKVKRTLEETPAFVSSKKAKATKEQKTMSKGDENKQNTIKNTKVKVPAKPVAKAAITKAGKSGPPAKVPAKIESESEDNDSEDDGSDEELMPVQKSLAKASAKGNIGTKVAKFDSSSDASDEEEDESDEEVDATMKKASIVEEGFELSAESGESDDDEEESEEEIHVKNQKVTVTKKPARAQEESDSDDSEEEDDDEDATVQQSKVPTGTVDEDSDASAESDDSDEEEESEEEPLNKKQKTEIHTPGKVGGDSTGTQTIFIKNLAWAVTEKNVREFFGKDVAEVRLAVDDTGRIKGFGHVEFKNEAAARKAVGKSGQEFLGREIFCDLARERGAQSAVKSTNGTPGGSRPGTDKTAFVKGFDKFQDEDTIRSGLSEFFEECGEVSNIRIPMDRETGQSKGFAYVEFASNDSFSKAMELNGEELNGRSLVVNEASQPSGDGGGGRGRGRGGGGRGFGGRGGRGGFGGRDRGRRGGFGGRDRGRGGRGGFGGGRGPKPNFGGSGSGKKTKFAD